MDFNYQFGEWDGWVDYLHDKSVPMFVLKCSRGHMLDSPIALSQEETDKRCMKCGERQN